MKIDVLEDGTVHIFSTSGAGGDAALQMVRDITASAEIGKTYLGKVVRLAEFGAFVELFPGTDGLLHISEISEHRIRDVRDELKLGDQVLVKVLSIEGNKVRLSRKALIKEAREKQQKAAGAGATAPRLASTKKAPKPTPTFRSNSRTASIGKKDRRFFAGLFLCTKKSPRVTQRGDFSIQPKNLNFACSLAGSAPRPARPTTR